MIMSKEQALKKYEEMINKKIIAAISQGKTKVMLPKEIPLKTIEELKSNGYYVYEEKHPYFHNLIGYIVSLD